MTAMQSRLLGLALLVSAVSAVMYVARGHEPASEGAASDELARRSELERDIAQSKARFDQGAYIAVQKQLSDRESVEVIVIPESYASELDTRCIVFQNSETRSSAMTCAGPLFRSASPGN